MPKHPNGRADAAKASPSGLKTFIDNHALPTLVGLSVSVATVVAGVMTYYTSQRLAGAEELHKAQLIELAAKQKAEILDATTPLKQTISDLTFKISSIERRLPGSGPSYLDVTSVSVGPESIKALGPKYKSFSGGDFYVAAPEIGNWYYRETTEFEFIRSFMPDLARAVDEKMQKALDSAPIHVWRSKSEIRFQIDNSVGKLSFMYSPAVSVQKITEQFIKDRMAQVQQVLSDKSETEKAAAALKAVAETIDKVHRQSNDSTAGEVTGTTPAERDPAAEKAVKAAHDKNEMLDKLSSIYSADHASMLMFDWLASQMMQAMMLGVQHRIYSAQKKGNVFYLQDRMTFQNATVDGSAEPGKRQNISIDQEVFFFGNGAEGYLVKVFLPPVPDRSDAFTWTKSWLAGLQIPLS